MIYSTEDVLYISAIVLLLLMTSDVFLQAGSLAWVYNGNQPLRWWSADAD